MSLDIRALTPHLGAEITGLDMRKPIDEATADVLRAAFHKHLLLLIRQPDVGPDDQVRFGNLFGEVILRTKYSVPIESPLTQYVSNVRSDGILGDVEIEFHQDHFFYDNPLTGVMLYAMEIPKSGSVTEFRNAIGLLDRLPADLRARAGKVKCLQDGDYTPWRVASARKPGMRSAWHPLIWTDPGTGRQALAVTLGTVVDYEGIAREEGRALLQEIWDFAASIDEFTYAHDWKRDDLLIWNNRMVQHARKPFDASEARTLRRTQIQ